MMRQLWYEQSTVSKRCIEAAGDKAQAEDGASFCRLLHCIADRAQTER
jgi:hypothetical protein